MGKLTYKRGVIYFDEHEIGIIEIMRVAAFFILIAIAFNVGQLSITEQQKIINERCGGILQPSLPKNSNTSVPINITDTNARQPASNEFRARAPTIITTFYS